MNGMFGNARKVKEVILLSPFMEKFTHRFQCDEYIGGCDTCGYGAEGTMNQESFNSLLTEMDEWIKETYPT